ncbi:MAG TPA: hypothetical protein VNJ53_06835 [Gaiellaceae bacterium]|nr:hypothetical protein [Gaiellaceae bacterium]
MKPSLAATLLPLTILAALCLPLPAGGYHTRFVAESCHTNPPQPTSYITRDGSVTVALRARYEGYQWGGGCWNDNDRDDSPGDPPETYATGGEGGDCSGFTFKVWRESLDTSDAGFYQWNMLRNVHGPYTAESFKNGAGAPNVVASKSALVRMDALASSGHVGMIYARNADGSDQIIEAKGEAYGTNIWTRTYRGDSSYGGVRRTGWSS